MLDSKQHSGEKHFNRGKHFISPSTVIVKSPGNPLESTLKLAGWPTTPCLSPSPNAFGDVSSSISIINGDPTTTRFISQCFEIE